MPNIKAKIKNVRKIKRANTRNSAIKSSVRTAIKKARIAAEGKSAQTKELVSHAKKELDKAVSKGVLKQNNASRRASRLDAFVAKQTSA